MNIYSNRIKIYNDSINSVVRDTLRDMYEYDGHATIYFNSSYDENQYIHLTKRHEDTLKVKYVIIDEATDNETVLTDLIFIRQ